jgi:hypothetical protein
VRSGRSSSRAYPARYLNKRLLKLPYASGFARKGNTKISALIGTEWFMTVMANSDGWKSPS